MQHTKSYLKGHPNPQFTRHDFVNLDGDWDFTFDDKNEGIKKKYFNKFPKNLKINVPVSYEYPASNVNDQIQKIINYYYYILKALIMKQKFMLMVNLLEHTKERILDLLLI